jgi:hypothetical protein
MCCCSWPLSVVHWLIHSWRKNYQEDSDSDSSCEPTPRFRDLGQLKHRFTRTYDLRPPKQVCYAEVDDDAGDSVE